MTKKYLYFLSRKNVKNIHLSYSVQILDELFFEVNALFYIRGFLYPTKYFQEKNCSIDRMRYYYEFLSKVIH